MLELQLLEEHEALARYPVLQNLEEEAYLWYNGSPL